MKQISLLLISLLFISVAISAKKKSGDSDYCCQIYIYGLATSFTDSTVYLTDIQTLDSAYLENGKFLGGLKQYSEQMSDYFSKNNNERICTVFFAKKLKKATKRYASLRKRYLNPKSHMRLNFITKQDFAFSNIRPDYDEDQMPEATKKEKKHDKPQGAPDGKRPPMGGPGGGMGGPGGGMGGPGGGMGNMGGMGGPM